jgi:hypothetical protein
MFCTARYWVFSVFQRKGFHRKAKIRWWLCPRQARYSLPHSQNRFDSLVTLLCPPSHKSTTTNYLLAYIHTPPSPPRDSSSSVEHQCNCPWLNCSSHRRCSSCDSVRGGVHSGVQLACRGGMLSADINAPRLATKLASLQLWRICFTICFDKRCPPSSFIMRSQSRTHMGIVLGHSEAAPTMKDGW